MSLDRVPDSRTDRPWLVADIGATNTRCALRLPHAPRPDKLKLFENSDFDSVSDVLGAYLASLDSKPVCGALAVAAPIGDDDVRMINRDWSFNRLQLASRLELERLEIINDFHAVAWALPGIGNRDRVEIGHASAYRDGNRAVLGPGSGLGVGAWIAGDGRGLPMTGEGGHVTLSARSAQEDRIIALLRDRYGHCSAERVLSGPGIIALHSAMHDGDIKTSREITSGTVDPKCRATMEQFYRFLASVSADLAMTTGAYGGLFIAGGIVPAHIDQIRASSFRERFEDKNRYRDYMHAIPTYVITDPTPGLTGLAAFISRL
jgi:glucokinase